MANNPAERSADIEVIVVSESSQQRLALCDTVSSCGFTLIDCLTYQQVKDGQYRSGVDIWLVASEVDEGVVSTIEATEGEIVLLGLSPAPSMSETQRYSKWQRQLKRKLASMLAMPEIMSSKRFEPSGRSWQFMVLLGASLGGPNAIKVFLDNISAELPICILLAQHFNEQMIHALPRILTRHNDWDCRVISTTQLCQPGQCLVVPIDKKIVCDSNGRIILCEEGWEGEYKPTIGELLRNTSEVFGDDLVSIIFSGMGNDGTQYLQQIQGNNSQLWVQDPAVSACASQPQAIIDAGFCQFTGTPEQLASKLTDYVTERLSHD